jgi:hypothetical protein
MKYVLKKHFPHWKAYISYSSPYLVPHRVESIVTHRASLGIQDIRIARIRIVDKHMHVRIYNLHLKSQYKTHFSGSIKN